ncbi:chemotaxis protein CheC [Lutispora sp.]|nr:chemotaxis protein CheC [Lutispora sp.]MEA4960980.1 chemotaxis protein CheC [Lutispora sp.]HCJ56426.1 chemotaxis protein CheC [Clostridiaceae bacterium]
MNDKPSIKNKSLKYDMLAEMFNIGVGKSASLLSEIIGRKILLDVSKIEILCNKDKNEKLEAILSKISDGALMVSSIEFEEKITGKANLIFPTNKMRTFINLCMNQEIDNCGGEINFTDIDFDVIKEIGNIVLNSIMGEIGNFLDVSLNYSLPQVEIFDRKSFKSGIENTGWSCIIMLYISFTIDGTEVRGAIIINLTLNSLNELLRIIDKMEEDLYE